MNMVTTCSLAIGAWLATTCATPAVAQQTGTPLLAITQPVVNLVDENHVSLVSGRLELSFPLLKMGDVEFEIHTANGHLSETQPEDNNQGKVITCLDIPSLPNSSSTVYSETGECSASIANPTIQAVHGSQRASFYLSSGVWVPEKGDGETFVDPNNGYCTWTQRDGTQIAYYAYHASSGAPCQSGNIAKITDPNGRVTDYYYYGSTSGSAQSPIRSIATSDGFLLQYNYPGTPTYGGETSVTAINRAFQACDPAATCSTTGWPTATLSWASDVLTATTPKQEKYVLQLDDHWRVISYQPPGATQPKFTYTYCTQSSTPPSTIYYLQNCFGYTYWDSSIPQEENQVQQYFIDEVQDVTREGLPWGGHSPQTDLNFSYPAWVRYHHYSTTPAGGASLVGNQSPNMYNSSLAGGPIISFGDKDGTGYSFDLGVSNRLHSVTTPSGIVTTYGYDNWGNVTSETVTPNQGTGSISRSAIYPGNCTATTLVTCNKPTDVTDANGNTTHFVYDSTHGGVLKETDPAVGGVTPQKRYTYVQRYPWYLSSGTMTRETRSVWLLSTESYCRASAPAAGGVGCAAANDEVVATYDYGPDSGPNNLLLRGQTVTSAGITRRSCSGHDKYGNKIWEQAPNANASSCPSY